MVDQKDLEELQQSYDIFKATVLRSKSDILAALGGVVLNVRNVGRDLTSSKENFLNYLSMMIIVDYGALSQFKRWIVPMVQGWLFPIILNKIFSIFCGSDWFNELKKKIETIELCDGNVNDKPVEVNA